MYTGQTLYLSIYLYIYIYIYTVYIYIYIWYFSCTNFASFRYSDENISSKPPNQDSWQLQTFQTYRQILTGHLIYASGGAWLMSKSWRYDMSKWIPREFDGNSMGFLEFPWDSWMDLRNLFLCFSLLLGWSWFSMSPVLGRKWSPIWVEMENPWGLSLEKITSKFQQKIWFLLVDYQRLTMRKRNMCSSRWRFPKIGLPRVIIQILAGISFTNHPKMGYPHFRTPVFSPDKAIF